MVLLLIAILATLFLFSSYPSFNMFTEYFQSMITKRLTMTQQNEAQTIALIEAEKNYAHYEEMIDELLADDATETVYKQGTNNDGNRVTKLIQETARLQIQEVGNSSCGDDYKSNSNSDNIDRLRALNEKLLTEIAVAKDSEERFLQGYEGERMKRKMLENRCNQLDQELEDSASKLVKMNKDTEYMLEELGNRDTSLRSIRSRKIALEIQRDKAEMIFQRRYHELDDLRSNIETFLRKNCKNYGSETVLVTDMPRGLPEPVDASKVIGESVLVTLAPLRTTMNNGYFEEATSSASS